MIARKLSGSLWTARVFEFIHKRGERGATDEEIRIGLKCHDNTTRPRRVQLRDEGHVRNSGRKRLTASGRDAIVWVAAEFARKPLERGA